MTHTEARELANQFGSRMCDENGDTHNQELYCFDLDDIIAIKEALAQRTWVGLTKQQQLDIFAQSVAKKRSEHEHYMAIEQALKEKNT